ncbi:MAG: FAD-dependent oxidoreductase, partial [Atribacterota bacterium]
MREQHYEVIVIGGGHAGCEAAYAASQMGLSTLLVTTSIHHIALMPCNPAIGGPGKGHVVREIDALGGLMGRVTDQCTIHIKKVNTGKGPAVQTLRAQTQRDRYSLIMREFL